MTEKKTAKKSTQKAATGTSARIKTSNTFTAGERAAMRDRVREKKSDYKADGESALRAALAEMQEPDRTMGKGIHEIITASAPELSPRTWYGMPAYAKDDKVVCFFQPAAKFNARYATIGFNDDARLDDGTMWPTAFALKELIAADEKKIAILVKKAVS